MKVIVKSFYRTYVARVDNCIWIFITQLYRIANESNCINILSNISCKG